MQSIRNDQSTESAPLVKVRLTDVPQVVKVNTVNYILRGVSSYREETFSRTLPVLLS